VPSKSDTNLKTIVRDLEARVDKLELIAEALWTIIQNETNLSEVDLIERITEIDLKDGKFDNKKKRTSSVECKHCGRMNSKRQTKCLYCGAVFLLGPFQ
jgi:hypothetical protein